MIITTTPQIEGHKILEYKGFVESTSKCKIIKRV